MTFEQTNHFDIDGKSEIDIYNLISEAAKEQLKPWLPPLMDEYKKLDSDLYLWKRKMSYQKAKNGKCRFVHGDPSLFATSARRTCTTSGVEDIPVAQH